MKQTERIRQMEERFDRVSAAQKALEEALEAYKNSLNDYKKLENYYIGGNWMKDYEADEAGKLPKDLKRGVLSEDGLYDLLTSHDELKAELAETAAFLIRKDR